MNGRGPIDAEGRNIYFAKLLVLRMANREVAPSGEDQDILTLLL